MEYKYREGLAQLPIYDVTECDWNIKVNANECNLNLPPAVEDRVMGRLSRVAFNRYPNTEAEDLKEQIAENFGLQTKNVLLGNGSSEILEKIFQAFGGPGRKIVYPQPSFSMYKIYAKLSEAEGIPVELEADYSLDAEKFVQAVKDSEASLAVLCTPNNPTGNAVPLAAIEYIAENIDCVFVVDEAYVEFHGLSAAGSLLKKYPNMIVARTFSKAYGLAAARVGYMLAEEKLTAMIGRVFMPYSVNVLSLVTADIVYQMRHEYVPRIQMMVAERKRMAAQLETLAGFTVYPSETNFLLVKYERAAELNAYLENIGIGLRSFGDAPRLENCLRISMGTREENDAWFKAIQDFLGGR
ncbi:MAG: histidinol-phosphate transaminase [Selenomonadaceae bacterium]